MKCIQDIYEAIDKDGFTESTLQIINELVNDIENGSTDLPRFNQREHSGICKAGSALIGASIVASYATRSLTASSHAGSGQTSPSNWEIDELQEKLIVQWAKAARLWVEASDDIVRNGFGPMIAEGAEAKVYYRDGSPAVLKERASIYSTTQKAIDAIALHNYIFPETAMHVIGLHVIQTVCFVLSLPSHTSDANVLQQKKKLTNLQRKRVFVTTVLDRE